MDNFTLISILFYIFAAAVGIVFGFILRGVTLKPSGTIIVVKDEDGEYLFLEANEEVSDLARKKHVVFDVSRK